ncbi:MULTISPECIES: DUF86 domain-containing protein [Acidithrix]|uniref:DUF86 domain-containing protein n=1 Tax=Acidithrix ferrooxidans TaxID=1280514 RepID=A0A0D8HHB7_9ACTN|nr:MULTISPECIES: DUF86 domain-containing protein [Acidithrix]KJF17370.1 hypothetical protein AXFE_17640 [Acidithrix ferrooxidans]
MNENRLPDYLEHMKQAAADACAFVEGLDKADFFGDKRTQQAVIMSLVIVGEPATLIMGHYSKFALDHAEVPWRNMRGMRNQIAHGYFALNLEVVWETVRSDLPTLLSQLPLLQRDAA